MASFELAIPFTLKNEGGDKFTEDPRDLGGATKYGISLRFYRENEKAEATKDDIETLSESDAESIYLKYFWNPNNYGGITNQSIASKIFDMGVNMGCAVSNKISQRALQAVNGAKQTIEDGIMGVHTISCINDVNTDRMSYLSALKEGYASYYRHIVEIRPSDKCFLDGWLKRAYS